jgi:hypothetical protein
MIGVAASSASSEATLAGAMSMAGGGLAMAVTAGVGRLLGTSVG